MECDIIPVMMKMDDFEEFRKKGTTWHSRPFYSGMGGYKMCLSVEANGDGAGKGTHVTVFTHLMCGEFDSHLKWPFRGSITIELVNQLEDKEHFVVSYSYTDRTPDSSTYQRNDGARAVGWGRCQFILHSELGLSAANNCQYLKDDCLVFRIVSIV